LTEDAQRYALVVVRWAEASHAAGTLACGSRGRALVRRVVRILASPPLPTVSLSRSWRAALLVGTVAVALAAGTVRVVAMPEASRSQVVRGAAAARASNREEPAAGTVQVLRKGNLEITLVYVPSGWFAMGTDPKAPEFQRLAAQIGLQEGGVRGETPQRHVWVSGFWVGKTEVTNAQFAEFVKATGHRTPCADSKWGSWRSEWMANDDSYPVVDVTWQDAQAFCDWCGCQLPSEAQWEYAARGQEGRFYPWGNEWDPAKVMRDSVCPVGCVRADRSWCGTLDMGANVAEWCRDAYQERFYASSQAGSHDPECRDPKPEWRTIRGGSWHGGPRYCRAAARLPYPAVAGADIDLGFRVVRAR
jgi:iron(II)-dependent oxidoreductase